MEQTSVLVKIICGQKLYKTTRAGELKVTVLMLAQGKKKTKKTGR